MIAQDCQVKHPHSILWLGEIYKIFCSNVQQHLYVCLISFMDALQQAVDLKDLQVVLCHMNAHSVVKGRQNKTKESCYFMIQCQFELNINKSNC